MNIGIDVDGVLVDLETKMLTYGTKFSVENNLNIEVKPEEYWETKKFNWLANQEQEFWNKYLVKYVRESEAREFASEVIEKLMQEGNNIYIITARNEYGMPKEYYGKMQEFTKEWLDKNKIKYDKLIFKSDKEKLQCCLDNKVDIMIEDSPSNILDISKKVKVIKYDCPYNQEVQNSNIIKAYSWYHIYDIINKLIKEEK